DLVIAGTVGPPLTGTPGSDLILGIRPEHVELAGSGHPAVIESTEYFGADSIIACRIAQQRLLVRAPGRPGLAPGAGVHLAWPARAGHFFEKSTGIRCP